MRVVEKALTFDDVLLVPAHSTILPREVDLSTQLTRTVRISMNTERRSAFMVAWWEGTPCLRTAIAWRSIVRSLPTPSRRGGAERRASVNLITALRDGALGSGELLRILGVAQ